MTVMSCFLRKILMMIVDKEREHSCAIKSNKLITPQNYTSWLTLFEAAKIRCFEPILNLAKTVNEGNIPSIAIVEAGLL